MRRKIITGLLALVMMAGLMFTGCAGDGAPAGETIKLGYVQWACAEASTHLAQAVIMDELGYEVKVTSIEAGALYDGLADGALDAQTTAWLPVTHADYMEQYGDQIDDYGQLYNNARIGLVVPTYVDIDSIEELNEHVDQFGGRIVGIDGGAGIMIATEQAIEDYPLELELVESSDMAMTAALDDAYLEGEWIVVTGWTPHWKFASFDLKFLEDPKGVYGGAEDIHVMARQGLEEDAPDVANFLKNYYLEDYQLGEIIGAIADGAEPLEAAREWIAENEDVVEGWLQ
ncbi:MAG: glycine betaine ABC transporter substrate-binding protein [Firmicutes bacterium]|nr:glycine betaine ABC transporter substrate-binding protein [Bacillota bacterium]